MYPIEEFLEKTNRVKLLYGPTPFYKLENHDFYIKRDDLTGIGPGGNKIRSLEFILGDALSKNAKKILVSGPLQSNLCTLTACSCAKLNLDCELILNGKKPSTFQGNLLLNHLLNVKTHYLGECDSTIRNQYMENLHQTYLNQGISSYIIKNGATTGHGALGYVSCIVELTKQCSEKMTIFAPGGNGGVASGLIYGNELLNHPFEIVIISVEDDKATLTSHIENTISELEEITHLKMPSKVSDVATILDDYRGEGWAINTPKSSQEVLDFSRSEGIFIENIYTSKVLVGMKDYLAKNNALYPACFLHTGGFASLFSQY